MSKQFTFSQTPVLKRSRSRFDLSHKNLTSGNMGELIPFYLQEVYPGDTFKLTANCVVRTSSPLIKPIMDNLFLDTYFFFVPSRLVFDNWQRVFGENTDSPWANSQEYVVPKLLAGGNTENRTVVSKTVPDYLGIPVGHIPGDVDITLIPFRGFAKIWDDWFRDQNNVSPMHIQKGVAVASEVFNSKDWSPSNYMGKLPKVAKMHDYFTSCLPSPQKGSASEIPLTIGKLPVKAEKDHSVGANPDDILQIKLTKSASFASIPGSSSGTFGYKNVINSPVTNSDVRAFPSSSSLSGDIGSLVPDNLWADGTNASGGVTVNDMRLAFQLQKMLERDARGGTRYVEYLLSHFGVSSGDARLQRSEFLGGKRTPLNINQVTQTSASTEQENLGEQGAYSLTFARARSTKGFVEHGFVFGVCCIRQFHTYQQGVEKFWTRTKRTDFYDPVFANIGEQPVYKSELLASAGKVPFGYNEAWADLRYRPNKVTGQMRSGATTSLDIWHLADNYINAPTLNAGFIEETPTYLDRVLTVDSTTQDQFIMDFYVQNIAYRELPTYSIPSLIDHN